MTLKQFHHVILYFHLIATRLINVSKTSSLILGRIATEQIKKNKCIWSGLVLIKTIGSVRWFPAIWPKLAVKLLFRGPWVYKFTWWYSVLVSRGNTSTNENHFIWGPKINPRIPKPMIVNNYVYNAATNKIDLLSHQKKTMYIFIDGLEEDSRNDVSVVTSW